MVGEAVGEAVVGEAVAGEDAALRPLEAKQVQTGLKPVSHGSNADRDTAKCLLGLMNCIRKHKERYSYGHITIMTINDEQDKPLL